jgi:hypothetical protein
MDVIFVICFMSFMVLVGVVYEFFKYYNIKQYIGYVILFLISILVMIFVFSLVFKKKLKKLNKVKDKNNNEKALEFLNQYISLISNTRRIRYCKDSFINAALDYYYNICKDNKIKFNCKLNNIEDALKIPSHEVAVVISNCLENAINASLRLESNRLINFTFLNNNGRLVLKVENNYNGIIELDEENKPTNHEENHGIGTASIQYFAKRNDLIIDYEMSDNVFKITILFK